MHELGTNIGLRLLTAGGDLEAAFAQAEHVVRQRYRVPRLAPARWKHAASWPTTSPRTTC